MKWHGGISFFLMGAMALGAAAQAPARPAITGIAFMRLYTTDSAAAQKFYGPTMGFERREVDGTWVYPVNHSQWIEVLPNTPPPTPNGRMAAIAFTTVDAAGLERYLNAKGVATTQPLHDGEFGVRDPEGNLVIFVQHNAKAGVVRMVAEAKPSPDATSRRIIHVGFIVHDPAKEDPFWREILGFRPYWHGTMHAGRTDWVSQQVPDGTDWLEYMLHINDPPSLHDSGMQDHFSLGVERMQTVLAALQRNGCEGKQCTAIQAGADGKIQLNLFDPDQTRVEYMEFTPAMKPCCSEFTGKHPGPNDDK
ncbi:MAG TPA: VOC family protein [Acidobacteriaceae bacterium]|jgi:catechol 2,3-dioxygenase-like lactoylglutathione lyase family enzyme